LIVFCAVFEQETLVYFREFQRLPILSRREKTRTDGVEVLRKSGAPATAKLRMSQIGRFPAVSIFFRSTFHIHYLMADTREKLAAGSGAYPGISLPIRENFFEPVLFLYVAPFDSRTLQMKTCPRTNAGDFGQIVRYSGSYYLPQCGHWPFNTLMT